MKLDQLSEPAKETSKLVKLTVKEILRVVDQVNHDYSKFAEANFDLFMHEETNYTRDGKGAGIVLRIDSNAPGERVDRIELLWDALDHEGLIGGTYPLKVDIGESAFFDNKIVVRLSSVEP